MAMLRYPLAQFALASCLLVLLSPMTAGYDQQTGADDQEIGTWLETIVNQYQPDAGQQQQTHYFTQDQLDYIKNLLNKMNPSAVNDNVKQEIVDHFFPKDSEENVTQEEQQSTTPADSEEQGKGDSSEEQVTQEQQTTPADSVEQVNQEQQTTTPEDSDEQVNQDSEEQTTQQEQQTTTPADSDEQVNQDSEEQTTQQEQQTTTPADSDEQVNQDSEEQTTQQEQQTTTPADSDEQVNQDSEEQTTQQEQQTTTPADSDEQVNQDSEEQTTQQEQQTTTPADSDEQVNQDSEEQTTQQVQQTTTPADSEEDTTQQEQQTTTLADSEEDTTQQTTTLADSEEDTTQQEQQTTTPADSEEDTTQEQQTTTPADSDEHSKEDSEEENQDSDDNDDQDNSDEDSAETTTLTTTTTTETTTTTTSAAPTTEVITTAESTAATTSTEPVTTTTTTTTTETITTVKPSLELCNNCVVNHGVGYAPFPGYCDAYIQCRFYGALPTAVDIRRCPSGNYWNQDKLICDFQDNVKCTPVNNCPNHKAIPGDWAAYSVFNGENWTRVACPERRTYNSATCGCTDIHGGFDGNHEICTDKKAIVGDKTGFLQFTGNGWVRMSCPATLGYNEQTCRCTDKLSPDTSSNVCPNTKPIPGDKSGYLQFTGVSWIARPCPATLVYHADKCICSYDQTNNVDNDDGKNKQRGVCKATVALNFDNNDATDSSVNHFWVNNTGVTFNNGKAYFNGKSRLTIPGLSNMEFGSTVYLFIKYRHSSANSQQTLVSNGDCQVRQSLAVCSGKASVDFYAESKEQISLGKATVPSDVGAWQYAMYALDNGNLLGSVGANRISQPVKGALDRRQRGLVIGGGGGCDNFHGIIDDVRVYLCKPLL